MIRNIVVGTLAIAMAASAASAGIVRITLTGTSESIHDNANVFGLGAGTLTNEAFVETFIADTAVNPNGSDTGIYSNSIFDAAPPFAVGGTLTINGHSFAVAGSNYSGLYTTGDYQILTDDAVGTTRDDNSFYVDLTGAGLPQTISQPFSTILTAAQVANVSFGDASSGGSQYDAIGNLYPTRLTVEAVPEPAGWALLVAGFGLVGAIARRGRPLAA